MKSSALLIKTPEGIMFSLPLAGPVTRFLAWLIDLLIIGGLMYAIASLLRFVQLISPSFGGAVLTIGYFIVSIGYAILLEWVWRGQTIGKKFLRLRVVDAEGMRLQFDQVVTRNLVRFVDMLPAMYFVGGMTCWLNRKCQRLGDIAANTVVIRAAPVAEPDLDQVLPGKFNSLRQYPHLAARLRQRVSPGEAGTALQSLIRRDEFESVSRVELFGQLAAHFQAKVEFPPEATDGVPDEQYIRNVVDVVFRSG
jgi:uncharacterized RDD family membrane protein YckC